jgi:hypothetical protein
MHVSMSNKPFFLPSSINVQFFLVLLSLPTIVSTCLLHLAKLFFEPFGSGQGPTPCHYFGKSPPQPIIVSQLPCLSLSMTLHDRHHQSHYFLLVVCLCLLCLVGKVYPINTHQGYWCTSYLTCAPSQVSQDQ